MDGGFVVGDVFVECSPHRYLWFFEFQHEPWQAVDEADHIRPAGVHLGGHRQLADRQERIVGRLLPIDHAHTCAHFGAGSCIGIGDRDAILHQSVDFAVGCYGVHAATVPLEQLSGDLQRLGRDRGIEPLERADELCPQDDFRFVVATERTFGTEHFVPGVDGLPTQLGQYFERGLFDQMIFGIVLRAHMRTF